MYLRVVSSVAALPIDAENKTANSTICVVFENVCSNLLLLLILICCILYVFEYRGWHTSVLLPSGSPGLGWRKINLLHSCVVILPSAARRSHVLQVTLAMTWKTRRQQVTLTAPLNSSRRLGHELSGNLVRSRGMDVLTLLDTSKHKLV